MVEKVEGERKRKIMKFELKEEWSKKGRKGVWEKKEGEGKEGRE